MKSKLCKLLLHTTWKNWDSRKIKKKKNISYNGSEFAGTRVVLSKMIQIKGKEETDW